MLFYFPLISDIVLYTHESELKLLRQTIISSNDSPMALESKHFEGENQTEVT